MGLFDAFKGKRKSAVVFPVTLDAIGIETGALCLNY